jgi:23S rRNA maturation mini-RNase III
MENGFNSDTVENNEVRNYLISQVNNIHGTHINDTRFANSHYQKESLKKIFQRG